MACKVKAGNPLKLSDLPKFNRDQLLTGGAVIMSTVSASGETTNEKNNRIFRKLFLLFAANVGVNVLPAALRAFTLGGVFC